MMKGVVPSMLRGILQLFVPDVCRLCGGHLSDGEKMLCNLCRYRLPATGYHRRIPNPMLDRLGAERNVVQAAALFYYVRDTPLARGIHDFKYNHQPSLALEFGREMGRRIATSGFMYGIDMIVPVPVHFLRRMRRGYNQVELLAEGLGEICAVPVVRSLYARRAHGTQTGKTPEQRKRNLEGVFSLRNPEELDGRHILLIDDVCTTGSTLMACARVIGMLAPTCRISVLTLACTMPS